MTTTIPPARKIATPGEGVATVRGLYREARVLGVPVHALFSALEDGGRRDADGGGDALECG